MSIRYVEPCLISLQKLRPGAFVLLFEHLYGVIQSNWVPVRSFKIWSTLVDKVLI
jgi:hypothetical protein